MSVKNNARNCQARGKSVPHPDLRGFGPRLSRLMLLLMGAGNIRVPDRHELRANFGLTVDDRNKISHLTNVFEEPRAERLLRAIDQFSLDHHPAVQHVISKWPEHFKGREQQAIA